jgi:hypothetical protein
MQDQTQPQQINRQRQFGQKKGIMKMKLFNFIKTVALAVGAAWSVGSACADTISSTGYFTQYNGDVTTPDNLFETYVNGVQVLPTNPPQLSTNNILQGSLNLPAGTTSAEFKNRQVGLDFNAPSLVAFQGVTDEATPTSQSTPFKLGTITVENGIFFYQASFDITFTTQSTDSFYDNRTFSDTLEYVVTPNTGDPVINAAANADYVYFVDHPELGQIRVYETASGLGNIGSVDLYATVGSLDPLFFANPTGGVFIEPAPEPETCTLILLGFGLVQVVRCRFCAPLEQ